MRVLFDTNVLFAAFASEGLCLEAVETGAGRCQLVTSAHLLDELTRLLSEKLKLGPASCAAPSDLRNICELVDSAPLPHPVCRERDDDAVLAAAVTGGVDIIVTGDDDLLTLRSIQSIGILTPRRFIQLLEERR